jgi:hypothetical protein
VAICVAVMTLCASSPPLSELVQVWDFLLAAGIHLNTFVIAARFVLNRDQLLAATNVKQLIGKNTIASRSPVLTKKYFRTQAKSYLICQMQVH